MQTPLQTTRTRDLRANATKAEARLWSVLRNRQLRGAKFRRQVPIDRYFADFACVSAMLIVEVDGGHHTEREAYDAERTRALELAGWRVIRFDNNEVMQNLEGVGEAIISALELARA